MLLDVGSEWREAQISLAHHVRMLGDEAGLLAGMAYIIFRKTASVGALLEALCNRTCPGCGDPCCVRATVRYDFRDLLYLHFLGKGLPVGQPGAAAGKCLCLGGRGCVLPREMRPFMCTWYLCPGQMELVREKGEGVFQGLPDCLREIQALRKELEAQFLRAVSPY